MATATGEILRLVRKGIDVRAVHAHTRKPFRLYLCGDPALVASMRSLLLSGHDESVPPDAAACLETIVPGMAQVTMTREGRAILFLGRRGDALGADFDSLRSLDLPIFAITKEALRGRVFPHVVERCKGVEIAVGRRLPVMRETVAAKLTRDAANNALKVALASAVVDHIPVFGLVLGAFASAGDMVAITGIQMMLLLHVEAAYGRDPDLQHLWQLLPVVGGGFGWRMLARELSGFIPVAGIAIKGAIAYAGTIVVGEGVTFYYEHGRHMSAGQASSIYENTKKDALDFARELMNRVTKR